MALCSAQTSGGMAAKSATQPHVRSSWDIADLNCRGTLIGIIVPRWSRGAGQTLAPQGGTITVALSKFQNRITASWFDPADNQFRAIAGSPFSNRGSRQFNPPGKNSAGDPDWVLVLEAGAKR